MARLRPGVALPGGACLQPPHLVRWKHHGVLTADACQPSARTGAARQNTPAPPESEDLSAVARAMASAMEVDTPQAAHSKMDVEGESAKPAESKSAKPDVRP